jgi:hypothetical protein
LIAFSFLKFAATAGGKPFSLWLIVARKLGNAIGWLEEEVSWIE